MATKAIGAYVYNIGGDVEVRALDAGTIIHVGGVPFALHSPAMISGHYKNFKLAYDDINAETEDSDE